MSSDGRLEYQKIVVKNAENIDETSKFKGFSAARELEKAFKEINLLKAENKELRNRSMLFTGE